MQEHSLDKRPLRRWRQAVFEDSGAIAAFRATKQFASRLEIAAETVCDRNREGNCFCKALTKCIVPHGVGKHWI